MSELYKEALLEAKKLRQVAEIDARNRVIEQVSPIISKMISNEIKNSTISESIFVEQDEEELDLSQGDVGPGISDPMGQDGLGAGLDDVATDVPVAPVKAAGAEDLMNTSLPDAEGMITVDINDLFAAGAEDDVDAVDPLAAPEAEPEALTGAEPTTPTEPMDGGLEPLPVEEEEPALAPNAPTFESKSFETFKNSLNETASRLDIAFYKESISDIVKESLKQRLISLLENLDSLKESGLISASQTKINENKLEFLFLKLKEASEANTYTKISKDEETMKSLKEYAAELFEQDDKIDLAQDSVNSGDTGVPTDKEYSKHAAHQSGVSPEIGGPEDIKAAAEKHLDEESLPGTAGSVDAEAISDKEPGEKQWAEGEPPLDEKQQDSAVVRENTADANTDANEDVAEGAAGFGDSNEEPAVEFEVNDKEISEAVRDLRKENIRRKMNELKEASDGKDSTESWEDGEPEGGKEPAQDHLKEQFDDETDVIDLVDDEAEMVDDVEMDMDMGVDDHDGGEADLTLHVDLPAEISGALADLGIDTDIDVSVDGVSDDDYDDMGGDDDYEMDLGPEEEEVLVDDGMEEMAYESKQHQRKARLAETRLRKAKKLIEARNRKIAELQGSLQEMNLFTAKTVYLNKFLMREGLSKKAMRRIVEHLDNAKTIAEAKVVYKKIKTRLDEHASVNVAGSASRVTTPGSAKLNESVSQEKTEGLIDVSRWAQLAGIKQK